MPEGTDSGIGNGPQLQSPAPQIFPDIEVLPEQQPPDLTDSGPGNGPQLEQPQQLADSGAGNGLQSENPPHMTDSGAGNGPQLEAPRVPSYGDGSEGSLEQQPMDYEVDANFQFDHDNNPSAFQLEQQKEVVESPSDIQQLQWNEVQPPVVEAQQQQNDLGEGGDRFRALSGYFSPTHNMDERLEEWPRYKESKAGGILGFVGSIFGSSLSAREELKEEHHPIIRESRPALKNDQFLERQ